MGLVDRRSKHVLAHPLTRSLYAALLVSSSWSTSALAQSAETADQDDQQSGPVVRTGNEIIVTARRREENLQDIPVAVTVVNSQQLQERSVQDTTDLTSVVPGIRFSTSGTTSNPGIEARGASRVPLGDLAGSVIIYVADVPQPNEAVFIPTFDLANVQALKGPQGTLFGRNALTGAVLFAPREPDYDFGGYVTAGFGNYSYSLLQAAVNVPIVDDKVAVRLAGEIRKRDGFVRRVTVGDRANDVDEMSLRYSLLLDPTEAISSLTIFDYLKEDEAGGAPILYFVGPGLLPTAVTAPFFAQQQQIGPRAVSATGPQFSKREIWGLTNRTTFDIGNIQLKNIFGYKNFFFDSATDTDAIPGTFNHVARYAEGEQFTEEFQVLGESFNDRLNWIVGGFLYWQQPTGLVGNRSDVFRIQPWRQAYQTRRSKAVYGQFDYDFDNVVRGVSVTAGLRSTWDDLEVCSLAAPADPANPSIPPIAEEDCPTYPGIPGVIPPASIVETDYSAITYTLALNYQPTENLLVYFTHRKGFREGGVNTPAFVTPGVTNNPPCPTGTTLCRDLRPFQAFGPQTNLDYELGFKSDLYFGAAHLRANVAAYQTNNKELQTIAVLGGLIDITDPAAPPFGAVTYNGGESRVRGVEAELVLDATENLQFYAQASYSKGKEITPSQIALPGAPVNVNLAREIFNYGAGARLAVPAGEVSRLIFNVDYYHNDDNGQFASPPVFLPGYDLVNARATLSNAFEGPLDISLFVRNAFDEVYFPGTSSAAPAFGFTSVHPGEPRTYGLEATIRFGADDRRR